MAQRDAIANMIIGLSLFVIPFLILFSILIVRTAPVISKVAILTLYGLGFLLFLLAKLSVIKTGTWISFGSKQMSPGYRWLYRSGFLLMGLGFFLTLGLLIISRP